MKTCSKCKIEKELSEFNKQKGGKFGLRSKCKSCQRKYQKEYHQANKNRLREYYKEYYESNKEYIKELGKEYYQVNRERKNEYQIQRRQADSLFRIKCNLRTRTSVAFKNKGYSKNTKTQEMLGVDWEVCKAHIERQFTKGMNWDNYGEWHIDHIIPLASANNEVELKKLCHYSNLQPLWAEENLSKKDKITGQQNRLRL